MAIADHILLLTDGQLGIFSIVGTGNGGGPDEPGGDIYYFTVPLTLQIDTEILEIDVSTDNLVIDRKTEFEGWE